MCTIHVIRWLLIVLRFYGSLFYRSAIVAQHEKIPPEKKNVKKGYGESAAWRMINFTFQRSLSVF